MAMVEVRVVWVRVTQFRSSETVEAGVTVSPVISRTGATTPPNATAPASQGRSARRNGASAARLVGVPSNRHRNSPHPEPRYSSPARRTGSTRPTSSLANGVLAPNSAATA